VTHASEDSVTYEEWRVTGDPGNGYPPYDFVWSRRVNPQLGEPEAAARAFMAHPWNWDGGPTLSRRTVVVGPWTDVAT
jgi:hypothetical protein